MSTTDTAQATVERVLAEHAVTAATTRLNLAGSLIVTCRCGDVFTGGAAFVEHRAHVAAVIVQTQAAHTTLTDDERDLLASHVYPPDLLGALAVVEDILAARHVQAADTTDRDTLAAELERVSAERDEFFARLTKHERQRAERLAEQASVGDTGICRNCAQPITYEVVSEPGYNDRTGWSDGSRRDALVCFKAVHYAHVPLVGRERGIWDAATRVALGDAHDDRGGRR